MNLLAVPPGAALLDVSPPPNLTSITGPTLVGTTLNWYLYGVLTVQYFLYLTYSRNDRLAMKLIVHLLFALDTLQTILTIDDLFFWFVYNFGDTEKVLQFHWAFDVPTLDAIVGFLVQIVYCWRIWVLSGWRVIPAMSVLISLVATGAGFTAGIRFQLQKVPEISSATQAPMMLWLFGSAAVDVVLAGSMTYVLLRQRRDLPKEKSSTGERIMRLLTLTLETNAITAAVAVASIILFFAKSIEPPATNFYQLGGYILGKLYSNCFMILLNQRHHNIQTRGQDSRSDPSGLSIEFGPGPGPQNSNYPRYLEGVRGPQMRYPAPPKVRVLISEDIYQDQ